MVVIHILSTYKLKNTNIKNDEQQMIIKALETLSTSYTNHTLDSIIEKYIPLSEKKVDKEFFGILVLQKRINRFKMLIKHWNKR